MLPRGAFRAYRYETSYALDETLSVVQRFLDLVHAWLNIHLQQLFEPAKHLGLHLGTVSRRDLTNTARHTASTFSQHLLALRETFDSEFWHPT